MAVLVYMGIGIDRLSKGGMGTGCSMCLRNLMLEGLLGATVHSGVARAAGCELRGPAPDTEIEKRLKKRLADRAGQEVPLAPRAWSSATRRLARDVQRNGHRLSRSCEGERRSASGADVVDGLAQAEQHRVRQRPLASREAAPGGRELVAPIAV